MGGGGGEESARVVYCEICEPVFVGCYEGDVGWEVLVVLRKGTT